MKKFVFIILAALICFAAFDAVKAQSPTPTVGQEWVKYVLKSTSLASTKPTVIIPFYADQNVDYIQVMVAYATISGDSCNIKIYPSPNGTTFTSGFANRRTAFQWENGDGTVKVISDTVSLIRYPTAYLKIVCDTLSGITAGSVYVWIKPHFK